MLQDLEKFVPATFLLISRIGLKTIVLLKKVSDIFIALILISVVMGANQLPKGETVKIDYTFGILLMPNWQEPVTFSVLGFHEGRLVEKKHISKKEFILMASGKLKSVVNPEKKDLFFKYGVPQCKVVYDQPQNAFLLNCPVLNNLWKLRYQVYPGDPIEETQSVESGSSSKSRGWSKHLTGADERQLQMLEPFGIKKYQDYAIGKDAFDLIKAANDPSFVSRYK